MRRYHSTAGDVSVVVAAALSFLYLALLVDVFTGRHRGLHARALELDELVAISAIMLAGLLWVVQRSRRERRAAARRRAAEQTIRRLAFQDALTGLPNRRQFDLALEAAMAAPPGADACHGVFMLDLNGFKQVNDIFGHGVGDEVLIHVGGRITRGVREGDLVARFGGDEFVVLATQLSGPEAATSLALRIIEQFSEGIVAGGRSHAIGVAVGVALAPRDGASAGEVMRKADIALYRAKAEGHSALRFFESEMDAQVRQRDLIEQALRRTLADLPGGAAMRLDYQKLADLGTGRIIGFEAVPHWTDPSLGAVDPARFIPIAEDSGLIAALTDTLFRTACADAASWPAEVRLAFNISPALLRDAGFPARATAILAAAGLPPARVELGIPEMALVRNVDGARITLGALRAAGLRVALIGFGTGYSSLYHLRNVRIDSIRIDRGFIGKLHADRESGAIVSALVGLGVGLGLDVTVEGVATDEQRRFLAARGCLHGQGPLYSDAVSAGAALAMLRPDAGSRSG